MIVAGGRCSAGSKAAEAANVGEIVGERNAVGIALDVRRLDDAIRDSVGLGGAIEEAVAQALPEIRQAIPRIPLGRAATSVQPILKELRSR